MDVSQLRDLDLSSRILLGPGPSMVSPRVLRATAHPPVGHLDPEFLVIMSEVKALLRYTFKTENEFTIPLSGTGTAGMEAAIANFVEPGDRVLAAINGYFGERLADMAARYGGQVDRVERPWGEIFSAQEIGAALNGADYKLVTLVHGETSTGTVQRGVADIANTVHDHGALLVLDTVASLGGVPVDVDGWGVDICYSGSQKCLSALPGLAPFTVSPRALETFRRREHAVTNWYLDLNGLSQYWLEPHQYHHTAPVNTIYALREALRLVVEEGLETRFERHRLNAERLWRGLENMNLSPRVPEAYRLPVLTTPQLPEELDESALRGQLLQEFNIEIAGGFGPLAGEIWRIGLMGYSCRRENVSLLLAALTELLG